MIKIENNEAGDILTIHLSGNSVNSISLRMLQSFNKVIDDINLDKVMCLIIDSHRNHFCAGADLKERSKFSFDETISFLDDLNILFTKITSLQIPTFSFINGACLGGGLELALACDFRVCHHDALFGFPESSIGIIPGAGGTQRLTRLIGPSKALKWIFSANKFTGVEAFEDGIVDFLIEDKDKEDFISKFVSKILKNSPLAIKGVKKSINSCFVDHGYIEERKNYLSTLHSSDRNEGLLAFKEKRSPLWKNK